MEKVIAPMLKKGKAFEYPDLIAKATFKVVELVPWGDHVEVLLNFSPCVKIPKLKLAHAFYTIDGRLDGKASLQPVGRLRSEWAHKCACNLSDMAAALRAAWRQQPKVSRHVRIQQLKDILQKRASKPAAAAAAGQVTAAAVDAIAVGAAVRDPNAAADAAAVGVVAVNPKAMVDAPAAAAAEASNPSATTDATATTDPNALVDEEVVDASGVSGADAMADAAVAEANQDWADWWWWNVEDLESGDSGWACEDNWEESAAWLEAAIPPLSTLPPPLLLPLATYRPLHRVANNLEHMLLTSKSRTLVGVWPKWCLEGRGKQSRATCGHCRHCAKCSLVGVRMLLHIVHCTFAAVWLLLLSALLLL